MTLALKVSGTGSVPLALIVLLKSSSVWFGVDAPNRELDFLGLVLIFS